MPGHLFLLFTAKYFRGGFPLGGGGGGGGQDSHLKMTGVLVISS